MTRDKWELRVGAIRTGGKLFTSWDCARDALYRKLDCVRSDEAGRIRCRILATPKRKPCEGMKFFVDGISYEIARVRP